MKLSEQELLDLKKNPFVVSKVYGKYVQLKKEDSARWRTTCPFGKRHASGRDKSPSFDVMLFEQGIYGHKCLGCGITGNPFQFLQELNGVSFNAAVEEVRGLLAGTWHDGAPQADRTFRSMLTAEEKPRITFPVANCERFVADLQKSKAARDFLRSRGINVNTAVKMRVGFRQSIEDKSGKIPEELKDSGWIVFPYIVGQTVVGVKFRSVKSKFFWQLSGMKIGLFNTEAADPLSPLVLVEGEMDALAMTQAGYNAVSLPNATYELTVPDKDAIMACSELYLAGDNDGSVGEEKMSKLWRELNAFRLKWPEDVKDANQFLLESGSTEQFHAKVETLMKDARLNPMPSVYSLQESMLASKQTDMENHPQRLHWPWTNVDQQAILLPGGVLALTASSSGMGKTCLVANMTISAARQGETILNYQAELSESEFANLAAAYILSKDRNTLTKEDYREASNRIHDIKYYVGCNPDLNTGAQVMDLLEKAIQRLSPTIVVLDHLHHVVKNVDNEIQEQSNIMQRIKAIAQRYQVKFIVIGQPRKANQQNKGKVIDTSDFKGSEAVVSTSDVVMVLHRDPIRNADPANPPDDAFANETSIYLKKGRMKGRGKAVAQLMFKGNVSTFYEVAPNSSGFQTNGGE